MLRNTLLTHEASMFEALPMEICEELGLTSCVFSDSSSFIQALVCKIYISLFMPFTDTLKASDFFLPALASGLCIDTFFVAALPLVMLAKLEDSPLAFRRISSLRIAPLTPSNVRLALFVSDITSTSHVSGNVMSKKIAFILFAILHLEVDFE